MSTPSPAAAQPAPAEPAFDVAAIRENHSDHTARSHIVSSPSDGYLTVINVPMKMLLQFAFALPETRILGGPDWLNSIKFDIEAKVDSSVDDRPRALNSDQAKLLKQKMVQALLADRFKLVCHMETRELPVYAVVAAKGGPQTPAIQVQRLDRRFLEQQNQHPWWRQYRLDAGSRFVQAARPRGDR
jgi:uncharacterized protein (TIGR03435 family)